MKRRLVLIIGLGFALVGLTTSAQASETHTQRAPIDESIVACDGEVIHLTGFVREVVHYGTKAVELHVRNISGVGDRGTVYHGNSVDFTVYGGPTDSEVVILQAHMVSAGPGDDFVARFVLISTANDEYLVRDVYTEC